MLYYIIAGLSGGLTAAIMDKRGKSKILGILIGFFFPVLGPIIVLARKPKNHGPAQSPNPNSIGRPSKIALNENSISLAQSGAKEASQTPKDNLLITSSGGYYQEVAGESFHFGELARIAKSLGGDGEHTIVATLIEEPTNKYDKNAIAVIINGLTCGYIPRDETSRLRPLLNLTSKRNQNLQVQARVWSGKTESYDGRKGDWIASVTLDVPNEISMAIPVNQYPAGSLLWPLGNNLKVYGEENHLIAINELLNSGYMTGSCSAYLELRTFLSEKSKEVVGVYSSDELVGSLSPASSTKFAQIFRNANPNKTIYALGSIRGNAIAAEIVLNIKSPEKLSETEIQYLTS